MKLLDVYRKPSMGERTFRIIVTALYLGILGWYAWNAARYFIEGNTWYAISWVVGCLIFIALIVLWFIRWTKRDRDQISVRRVERPSDDAVTMAIPIVPSSEAISPEHYAMMRAWEGESFQMHRGEDGDWYDSTTGEKLPIQDGDR